MSPNPLQKPAIDAAPAPFADFAPPVRPQSTLRRAITAAYRRPETECLPPLVEAATQSKEIRDAAASTARKLIEALRGKHSGSGVEGLVQEYSLSSQEGVALMCLAERPVRIPDTATRDALIRDKIADGNWKSHLGRSRSLFVNAATWGLVVTGKLTSTVNDRTLAARVTRLISRCGEPVIRRGVDMAMRMMGEQFVTGETIEALKRSKELEEKGFSYSYDMLRERPTAADAERYYRDYESAIHATAKPRGRGIYEGPGISIKLSALHPRYRQAARVMGELLPRVKALALLAKNYDIGLNIDAEEADRLELSLDLLEVLCLDGDLSGWNGMGFVVQAYGKRCPFVLDFIIDLARRSGRRIMVRLVKGAYWDAEIKRAQLDGLADFPVFTRKIHTDVSYMPRTQAACRDRCGVPQFATHNAQTLAAIYHMAGKDFHVGKYEFQCLHGMGEPLYEEVVGRGKLDRPCRIYAPVGTHETLLAYLVRRLLENGANSSFVHRINDPKVSIDELIADPVEVVRAMPVVGAKHDRIALPAVLFGDARTNSAGFDLSNEETLASLTEALRESAAMKWTALPQFATGPAAGETRTVLNPGDHRDVVGSVTETRKRTHGAPCACRRRGAGLGGRLAERAACLDRAAELMQARMPTLLGLIIREAGKSALNAIAEVREAIDFLRYYAEQTRRTLGPATPLGPIVCISPWNFPLAIFTGQIAAALVAGNPVLAKPAEETPLIAAEGVRILREAGIPASALQLLPGDGRVGAALVAGRDAGVMFTGSTEVARLIQAQLADRLSPAGRPVPLIAETGGQNAMIVDSSALAGQVVGDVITSAFDSAGQRCSALRVLCLQEDVAGPHPDDAEGRAARHCISAAPIVFSVDVGPVITSEAKDNIEKHIERMRGLGRKVEQIGLASETGVGTFVPPTIIELEKLSDLQREVFGPVLHVIRYRRDDLDRLVDDVNATGYGLTFGLHTRLDETIAHVTSRIKAGNLYINRNIIGAVVGVQPFGGRGLSGTGPKAGGPLYLGRLVTTAPVPPQHSSVHTDPVLLDFAKWLDGKGARAEVEAARNAGSSSALGLDLELPGPVGERNLYTLHARGRILLVPATESGLYHQLAAALATGNSVAIDAASGLQASLKNLPQTVGLRVSWSKDWAADGPFAGALVEGDAERIRAVNKAIAALPGPLLLVQAASSGEIARNPDAYCLNWLVEEVSASINTAAAGGNASLMAIG
uniref:Bifunctional protein PutA n=1 Tax=Rhizobium meliloti TaxID=382 RepID=PUTA_RHIML|nr:RecName: Full=Bifunctional protein PutA; Includes: RecName: Full=Proline dehydrogenase; AltName: Full=Proline oxidase; Includes: RecName: Full=Delta-1-pyrroline-5-carboxylate dehydrogenase; Short=P5C dehydrogenase; AltName: Full=L-glutamate gamma-semialdehyde dehydrogenase [Sinorhizobium meliloti]CAA69727.1 putA [Sinorhizobium meliloti]